MSKEISKLKNKIVKILKEYGIRRAGIFGSYARGDSKDKSDVDILIEAPRGMGLKFVSLGLALENILGKKVDLLTYKGINYLLKKRILDEEVRIIWRKNPWFLLNTY